jgi:hypothetical protein
MPQKKNSQSGKRGKIQDFPLSATSMEKAKLGRPTIPENFLLGARNAWAALLEESWPEIGWHLRSIRDRRNSTIEDIRKAFDPVKERIHNPGLAAAFYRESTEPASPSEALKNRRWVGKLEAEIHEIQTKRDECQRSCLEVVAALKEANPDVKVTIQAEGTRRLERLIQIEKDFERLTHERDGLYTKTLDQEAHLFRSELLDFLFSRRYAIHPRNLANALAGLPGMRWRQSHLRCSRMSYDSEARPEFQVCEVVSQIWNHHSPAFEEPPIELFRVELLKRSRKYANTKQFLRTNWRDLKFAIGECWKLNPIPDSFPFVLTSIFMRNVMRQKNATERILAEQDRLQA